MGPTGSPRSDNCDALKALGYGLLSYLGTTRPDVRDFEFTDREEGVSYLGSGRGTSRTPLSIYEELRSRAHAN